VDRNAKTFCVLTTFVSINFSNNFILEIRYISYEASITKKSHVIRQLSSNGEIHLIFQESRFDENKKKIIDLDDAEIKIIMKKEASKPLLILREE
jgi:hypothetical protein